MYLYFLIGAIVIFIILLLAGLAIVNFSKDELISKYNQTSKEYSALTALNLARIVNSKYFYNKIKIEFSDKLLSDSYKNNNTLTLCSKYCNQNNLAGVAICAHELGHAFQFKNQPKKMQKYGKKLRTSKILSKFITPLMLLALICVIFEKLYLGAAIVGLALVLFFVALGVKFSTIDIEKEASKNAIILLRQVADFTEREIQIMEKFLNSAKMTYVADVLRSVLKWTGLVSRL